MKTTVAENRDDNDELTDGGFTAEACKTISAPRAAEAFLSFECRLVSAQDITGSGKTYLFVGRVLNAAQLPGLRSCASRAAAPAGKEVAARVFRRQARNPSRWQTKPVIGLKAA